MFRAGQIEHFDLFEFIANAFYLDGIDLSDHVIFNGKHTNLDTFLTRYQDLELLYRELDKEVTI